MEYQMVNRLWRAITILEARETLAQFRISAFPQLKQQKAERIESEVRRKAYPFGEEREATWEDLATEIGQQGVRVQDGGKPKPNRN